MAEVRPETVPAPHLWWTPPPLSLLLHRDDLQASRTVPARGLLPGQSDRAKDAARRAPFGRVGVAEHRGARVDHKHSTNRSRQPGRCFSCACRAIADTPEK